MEQFIIFYVIDYFCGKVQLCRLEVENISDLQTESAWRMA